MVLQITPGSIVSDGHVIFTGPLGGSVTLADGTEVDVSPEVIEVPADEPEKAAEIAALVGQRYAAEGHPMVLDDATGERRDFEYVTPDELAALEASTTTKK